MWHHLFGLHLDGRSFVGVLVHKSQIPPGDAMKGLDDANIMRLPYLSSWDHAPNGDELRLAMAPGVS